MLDVRAPNVTPVELSDDAVDAVARRLAEILVEAGLVGPRATRLVDAATVARHFGLSREWVYEHAEELGVTRLGNGPRPRLRFDLAAVEAALEGAARGREKCRGGTPVQHAAPPTARRRTRRTRPTDDLLPICGAGVESRSTSNKSGPAGGGTPRGPASKV